MNQPELFNRVIEIGRATVDRVDETMLDRDTPCSEWNVRQLINHMAITCRFSAATMDATPPTEDRLAADDVLGTDFKGAFSAAADSALASFNGSGAMERQVESPAGTVPGAFWASFPTWDLYVHTWDLATATGVAMEQPDDVTEAVLAWGEQVFGGERDTSQIGELLDVAADASSMDRLVAMFGRTPNPG